MQYGFYIIPQTYLIYRNISKQVRLWNLIDMEYIQNDMTLKGEVTEDYQLKLSHNKLTYWPVDLVTSINWGDGSVPEDVQFAEYIDPTFVIPHL